MMSRVSAAHDSSLFSGLPTHVHMMHGTMQVHICMCACVPGYEMPSATSAQCTGSVCLTQRLVGVSLHVQLYSYMYTVLVLIECFLCLRKKAVCPSLSDGNGMFGGWTRLVSHMTFVLA